MQGFIAMSWAVAIAPTLAIPILVLAYRRVLGTKKSEVHRLFRSGGVLERYTTAFSPGDQSNGSSNDTTAEDPLDELFNAEYHWLAYVPPILFLIPVTLGSSLVGFTALGFAFGLPNEAEQLIKLWPDSVIAGLAGAYIWATYDLLRRFASADLTPSIIYLASLRIIVAGILGSLVTTVVNESFAVPAAFGLGAFPTGTLRAIVKEQVSTRLENRDGGSRGESPTLQNIHGVTPSVATRLVEESIDSAEALAYANPVKLLLRTNLEFKVILDLIDQAFLYIYVGDRIDKLRQVGIRSATDLTDIGVLSEDNSDREVGEAMLGPIAEALEMQTYQVQNLIITFKYDPQIALIYALWGETK